MIDSIVSIKSSLTDDQLLLYSRQILLPQIDISGQEKLLRSKVLVLGAGGLGCPAMLYLAASGIGELHIVDDDEVELSNIQRQILFHITDIGRKKTEVAGERIKALNNDTVVHCSQELPDDSRLSNLIERADVVVDGTDNFSSRYRHNKLCVNEHTALVSGAVIRFEGQVTTFDNKNPGDPCYHCLYPDGRDQEENCSQNGVLGSVAGAVASVMATEVIKLITGVGDTLRGRLLLFDALQMEWRTVKYKQDSNCPVCKMKKD